MNQNSYLPKYLKIKNKIMKFIEDGKIQPGEKIPTEMELAKKYNASRHTVRKALNLLSQEGKLSREQGVGTFVKEKKKTETKNIGFVSISLHNYIFADIFSGIEETLHDNDYQVLLGNSKDDQEKEKEVLNKFLNKNVDGLIIEPARSAQNYPNINLLEKFYNNDIPVVILDSKFENNHFSYIWIDDVNGGYQATQYLIDMGHKNIGIIYKGIHLPGLRRFEGYKKALRDNDLPIYYDNVKEYRISEFSNYENHRQQIKKFAEELMNSDNPPTAIFCFNDQIAVLVKEIFNSWNMKVPEDISLIGFDNSELVKLSDISIASMAHPKIRAGRQAANIILDKIGNKRSENLSEEIKFSSKLIERNSVSKINQNS